MSSSDHYTGQRLSLKSQTCTVRYVGSVKDKEGEWLGVEWDDPKRGKHNGTHDGIEYFKCQSGSSTCASFLRPSQPWGTSRTFLQALNEKYNPADGGPSIENEAVYFAGGKQAEEIGFEKLARRQAKLQGIHALVLDRMRINHAIGNDQAEETAILCANITDLDLSSNLFESISEILTLCHHLPKLRTLSLDSNRFSVDRRPGGPTGLPKLRSLSMSGTLLEETKMNEALSFFPSLQDLVLVDNEIARLRQPALPQTLTSLDLTDNEIESLTDLQGLQQCCPLLRTVVLKRNVISSVGPKPLLPRTLQELDLRYNKVSSWEFVDALNTTEFPSLHHLRLTGNPLYDSALSAEGNPLTIEDGHMITIARLPQLRTFNYSKVGEKERLNAETYYLSQIGTELSRAPETQREGIIARHPRYEHLCAEYGPPLLGSAKPKSAIDPTSLAARLIRITFYLATHVRLEMQEHKCKWHQALPKSLSIYAVLGLVAKHLQTTPMRLRLVLETGERDPVGQQAGGTGVEWWDSDDEEETEGEKDGEWVGREVELVGSSRSLGTFVERGEGTIRVEITE